MTGAAALLVLVAPFLVPWLLLPVGPAELARVAGGTLDVRTVHGRRRVRLDALARVRGVRLAGAARLPGVLGVCLLQLRDVDGHRAVLVWVDRRSQRPGVRDVLAVVADAVSDAEERAASPALVSDAARDVLGLPVHDAGRVRDLARRFGPLLLVTTACAVTAALLAGLLLGT